MITISVSKLTITDPPVFEFTLNTGIHDRGGVIDPAPGLIPITIEYRIDPGIRIDLPAPPLAEAITRAGLARHFLGTAAQLRASYDQALAASPLASAQAAYPDQAIALEDALAVLETVAQELAEAGPELGYLGSPGFYRDLSATIAQAEAALKRPAYTLGGSL